MNLMRFAEQHGSDFCVTWNDGGLSFTIRDSETFVRNVVPEFFGGATKFSSFTRKLYRWGFRQVNRGIGPDDPIIFASDNFQRYLPQLMQNMRSVTATASKTNKSEPIKNIMNVSSGMKHSRDASNDDTTNKRLMLDLMGNKIAPVGDGVFSLTNVLCPKISSFDSSSMFQLNSNANMDPNPVSFSLNSFNPNPINLPADCFDIEPLESVAAFIPESFGSQNDTSSTANIMKAAFVELESV
jgi:hypothetical protein